MKKDDRKKQKSDARISGEIFFGCAPKPHIIEGRDLTPLLKGTAGFSRNYVISEHDYHWSEMAKELNQKQDLAHNKWANEACSLFSISVEAKNWIKAN